MRENTEKEKQNDQLHTNITHKSDKNKNQEKSALKRNIVSSNIYNEKNINGLFAHTVVKKWGNSYGIRFSKVIVEAMKLKEDDKMIITIADNSLLIKKDKNILQERLESFYNKPFAEIEFIDSGEEIDYGIPVGNEI